MESAKKKPQKMGSGKKSLKSGCPGKKESRRKKKKKRRRKEKCLQKWVSRETPGKSRKAREISKNLQENPGENKSLASSEDGCPGREDTRKIGRRRGREESCPGTPQGTPTNKHNTIHPAKMAVQEKVQESPSRKKSRKAPGKPDGYPGKFKMGVQESSSSSHIRICPGFYRPKAHRSLPLAGGSLQGAPLPLKRQAPRRKRIQVYISIGFAEIVDYGAAQAEDFLRGLVRTVPVSNPHFRLW
jgi:hypothetical protein